MTVAMILSEKGRHVVTSPPSRTMREVAQELMRHGIGALVIIDGAGEVVGIISERDLVSAIATFGAEALESPVERHMQSNPLTVHENDTVDSTMQTMTLERRRHLPVLRDGRLSGLVSIGDIVKYRIRVIEEEHRSMREYIAQA
ncbi:CBS domain-containing protein [Methylocystis sp. MJC1]|jgi:CBS domain-containing protein|uniref:CBS domain-containing protein n=1 Tax=Methylocystis sp. MJC1 TaxID=2654282 RepID=UPI0013EBEDAA|nr:CBS domain-containing protein [Methylocystis sp. MJC1]KAF2991616.1 Inosine-5'-monophosphate dehydrogenase [Methylocystis sp. MJC1]MBU6527145.1 CBS domain-containing protein [Methylocystis sp. MJC1]UZX13579.1 CBS domain-containing protein [Methylocystis sp. MJC1]